MLGAPPDVVGEMFSRAMCKYFTKFNSSVIRTVYIVDITPELVKAIQSRLAAAAHLNEVEFCGENKGQIASSGTVPTTPHFSPLFTSIATGVGGKSSPLYSDILQPKTAPSTRPVAMKAIHSATPSVTVAWTTQASPTVSSSTSVTSPKHQRPHRTSALTSSVSKAPPATSSSYKLRSSYLADTSTKSTPAAAAAAADTSTDDTCTICMCPFTKPKTLPKCKHTFCEECIDACFKKMKPACPVCGEIYGEIKGNQPKGGTMRNYTEYHSNLPGYEGCGTIVIDYHIPGGTQGVRTCL